MYFFANTCCYMSSMKFCCVTLFTCLFSMLLEVKCHWKHYFSTHSIVSSVPWMKSIKPYWKLQKNCEHFSPYFISPSLSSWFCCKRKKGNAISRVENAAKSDRKGDKTGIYVNVCVCVWFRGKFSNILWIQWNLGNN